ncbi:MAG: uncharacterized protein JWQ53_1797 [Klenkia sp.]|nr:uncharacterized protein [Klenkia sp.]
MGELCCDPRGMADTAPQGQRPPESDPAPATPSSAQVRAQKFNAANMVRSLLPLTVIILVLVGLVTLRQNPADPVRTVETASTLQLAAARAGYELLVPQDLSDRWRPTSIRTDAGDAVGDGDAVTLQIGWLSPGDEFAGYVVTDDSGADAVTDVVQDATAEGRTELGGRTWERFTTARGETALRYEDAGVVALVTGSAADEELETLAASVGPYSAG